MKSIVEILSIKRNEITYKTARSGVKFIIPICIIIVIGFVSFFSINGASITQICNSMCYIYNPVNTLYGDTGNIIFTSLYSISKESLDFTLPVVSAKVQLSTNGDVEMIVGDSIMVKATESGVVEDVGVTLDGIKYIRISHSLDVDSVVENLDIIGVKIGDIVKKGQDIATAKEGSVVRLKLYDMDTQTINIKIDKSKIVWLN
jgi:hypothetical protein